MAEANVISQLVVFTAGTALPTLANLGSNTDFSSMAGAVTIGSMGLQSDDADLDEDSVTLAFPDDSLIPVQPPRALGVQDHAYKGKRVQPFEFVCYGGGEVLTAIASDMTIASHVATPATSLTRKGVIIEVAGRWADYFPQCVLELVELTQGTGEDGVARAKFRVSPEATTTLPSGWSRNFYQAGA